LLGIGSLAYNKVGDSCPISQVWNYSNGFGCTVSEYLKILDWLEFQISVRLELKRIKTLCYKLNAKTINFSAKEIGHVIMSDDIRER
jgi:hypothetical protein